MGLGIRLRRGVGCTAKVWSGESAAATRHCCFTYRVLLLHQHGNSHSSCTACTHTRPLRLPPTSPQAILVCHLHRVAPTIATVFEIVALAGHLLPKGASSSPISTANPAAATAVAAITAAAGAIVSAADGRGGGSGGALVGAAAAQHPLWLVAAARGALQIAHGFAPAVVVAQAVRLAANLVREAEARRNADNSDDKATTEGGRLAGRRCVGIGLVGARFGCAWPAGPGCPPASTLITNGSTFTRPPVRALQLGLSSVPRVDPRVPRSLDEYCSIYREWLLLLRGRLQQQSLELPPEVFDAGENELMRYALCYNILQVRGGGGGGGGSRGTGTRIALGGGACGFSGKAAAGRHLHLQSRQQQS